jgi:hypothetical protein
MAVLVALMIWRPLLWSSLVVVDLAVRVHGRARVFAWLMSPDRIS